MAEKGASGKSLENRACQIPSAKQPQTAKNQGTPPKRAKKLPTIIAITYQRPQPSPDHSHHWASPLGKEPVMTVLGYANSQPEPCSHPLGLLSGGQNPRKPSAASNLPRGISAPPGQANADGRATRWACGWRGREAQS